MWASYSLKYPCARALACGRRKESLVLFMHGQFPENISVSTQKKKVTQASSFSTKFREFMNHCQLRPEMLTDYRCLKVAMKSELANR